MVKLKKARSISRSEFDGLSKLEQKNILKTTNAQFRPNSKKSKKRRKSPRKEGNKARKRH